MYTIRQRFWPLFHTKIQSKSKFRDKKPKKFFKIYKAMHQKTPSLADMFSIPRHSENRCFYTAFKTTTDYVIKTFKNCNLQCKANNRGKTCQKV